MSVNQTKFFSLSRKNVPFLIIIKVRYSNSRLILCILYYAFLSCLFLFSIHDSLRSTAITLPGNFIPTSAPFIPLASHTHTRVSTCQRNTPRGHAHRRCSPRPRLLFVFFSLPAAVFSIPQPCLPRSLFISSEPCWLGSAIVSPAHDGRTSVCVSAPSLFHTFFASLLLFFTFSTLRGRISCVEHTGRLNV